MSIFHACVGNDPTPALPLSFTCGLQLPLTVLEQTNDCADLLILSQPTLIQGTSWSRLHDVWNLGGAIQIRALDMAVFTDSNPCSRATLLNPGVY